jgi:AraC family transcriptional regulator of arabinose operon
MNVSHNKHEPDSFCYIVENGFGPDIFLFVHFILPAVVTINGIENLVSSNACIIYTPGQRQEYRHHNGIFLNDFLIFHVEDPHFVARYGLPENEIFYISSSDEIGPRLANIAYTITDKLIDRKDQTQQQVLRFFEALSHLCINNTPSLKRTHELKQRFIALRDEVKNNPRGWSVDKMAKSTWFTRSRFTVLYNEFFQISPGSDLVNIKIEHAKKLLKTTDMSIAEVSAACGYASVEHFIRIFNKQVNYTPLQYRKSKQP